MKEFIIQNNDAGQRLDRFIFKVTCHLPKSLLYKYIRKKRVKRNGQRCHGEDILQPGDHLQLYIEDSFFPERHPHTHSALFHLPIDIIYEDENILVVNKPIGLKSQPDSMKEDCLINRIKGYLTRTNAYDSVHENSFVPALCNRLDRNTSGLVIAAKNAASLRMMNEKLRKREIQKYYLAIVQGRPISTCDTIRSWITKDKDKNKVTVYEKEKQGAKKAVTEYRVLESSNHKSLLEVRLHTGRTHQIRAQFASIGHPLVGDSKYGQGNGYQKLCAYKLIFSFSTPAQSLEYLKDKEIIIQKQLDFFRRQL